MSGNANQRSWLWPAVAVVVVLALIGSLQLPKLPGFDWLGDAINSIGNGVDEAKGALDEAAADVSGRQALPLVVDLETVVRGSIEGQLAYGRVERTIEVGDAWKKYNSWLPFGDEWVHFYGGVWVSEAFVGGPVSWEVEGQNVSLTFALPTNSPDIAVRVEPRTDDDPQALPELGQIPGDETDTTPAREELNDWINQQELEDAELYFAASCWAIESAESLLMPSLLGNGFTVLDTEARAPVVRDDSMVYLSIRAQSLPPGHMGPPTLISSTDCQDVIEATQPEDYQPTQVVELEPIQVEDLELS